MNVLGAIVVLFGLSASAAVADEHHAYAATPTRAADLAVGGVAGIRTIAMNVVGRYAVVLTKGGILEGEPATDPILVERFAFGWQATNDLSSDCQIRQLPLTRAEKKRLMYKMPKPHVSERTCDSITADRGTRADIEAVRQKMQGPFTPEVAVSGRFARGLWYGSGGGATLFGKDRGTWTRITGGGGVLGVQTMREYGVPLRHACIIDPIDSACNSSIHRGAGHIRGSPTR